MYRSVCVYTSKVRILLGDMSLMSLNISVYITVSSLPSCLKQADFVFWLFI